MQSLDVSRIINHHALDKSILVECCVSCQRSVHWFCFARLYCQNWAPDHNGIWLLINMLKFANKTGGEISSSYIITLASGKWYEICCCYWFQFVFDSFSFFPVLNSHTSSWNWHTTLCPVADFDSHSVEMAKTWIDRTNFRGDPQYCCQILCHHRTWTVELCLLWSLVRYLFGSNSSKFLFIFSLFSRYPHIESNNCFERQI